MGDGIIALLQFYSFAINEHDQDREHDKDFKCYTKKNMPGGILLLDHPPGSFENLAARLRSEIFPVQICRTPEELLAAIEKEKPELLIAAGDFPEITAPQLAEQVYGKLSIPIILVLSTAGEETQTFLRRHPAVIGVYYRPLNIEKILDRIRRFFNRQEP